MYIKGKGGEGKRILAAQIHYTGTGLKDFATAYGQHKRSSKEVSKVSRLGNGDNKRNWEIRR